ncbi:hypothetical protein [Terribacillus sp. 7520-G]|uniref:hypothetical protein n=1 Tax=Terribacillus TaxID=459532 RepID=UPI00130459EB|nr:hypothetical protein [Terribacillus sp. 7520-G]
MTIAIIIFLMFLALIMARGVIGERNNNSALAWPFAAICITAIVGFVVLSFFV